jgi:hypothetical protein
MFEKLVQSASENVHQRDQSSDRRVAGVQASFKTPSAALRVRLRGLDRAGLDAHRALLQYIWAMMVLTGQDNGTTGLMMFGHYSRIDKDMPPLGEDACAVLRGLTGMTVMRTLRGPPRRKRRNRLKLAHPIIRLDDHHYVTAWFVEQLRHHLVIRRGWRRCPAKQLDRIIGDVVACASERFGVDLSEERIRTIINEPKNRRYTHIFYLD